MSSDILSDYISNIKQQTEIQKSTFISTLDLIPSGVVIIDIRTKEIVLTNKQMKFLLIGASIAGEAISNS
jgi:hypothetical protein